MIYASVNTVYSRYFHVVLNLRLAHTVGLSNCVCFLFMALPLKIRFYDKIIAVTHKLQKTLRASVKIITNHTKSIVHSKGGICMKKQTLKSEGVIKKVVKHMVDSEQYGWPPQCSTFLYQPIRPKRKRSEQSEDNSETRNLKIGMNIDNE